MNNRSFFIVSGTEALQYTRAFLEARGCKTTKTPQPDTTHLILPVPAFQPDGHVTGGCDLDTILKEAPPSVTIIGGNLNSPILQPYAKLDLLQDEGYLAQNAAVTAECALRVAGQQLPITLQETQVLILGYGRIAKCLAKLLDALGADVTIAARKESDLAMAAALGYNAIHLYRLPPRLGRYRLLFNTIPALVLDEQQMTVSHPDCIKIDLASKPGISGSGVIWARGLPGKMAPETAGQLIAKTILGHCMNKEVIV